MPKVVRRPLGRIWQRSTRKLAQFRYGLKSVSDGLQLALGSTSLPVTEKLEVYYHPCTSGIERHRERIVLFALQAAGAAEVRPRRWPAASGNDR
jgi:hypothetical protein